MKGKPSVPDFFPVCDCGRNSLSHTGSYIPNCYLSVACGLIAVNYASASAVFPLHPLPFAHGFCKHNYRQRRAWAIHRQSKMRFEPALRRTLSNNAPGGRERNMRLGCAYFLGFPRGRERNMRAGTSYFRGFLGGVNGTCSQGANSINPIGHLITHFGLLGCCGHLARTYITYGMCNHFVSDI